LVEIISKSALNALHVADCVSTICDWLGFFFLLKGTYKSKAPVFYRQCHLSLYISDRKGLGIQFYLEMMFSGRRGF
jgi:hypothetical protein